MSTIERLGSIDFISWTITGFLILAIVIAIYEIICKTCAILGKPIGVLKQRKEDHDLLMKTVQDLSDLHAKHEEDTKQSIRHDEIIRDDLRSLTVSVNGIADKLEVMQQKSDATEMAKLKEKILGYFRKYASLGEWEKFEADVFWGLYENYISRGGNSFVKHDIEPTMRSLKVIK